MGPWKDVPDVIAALDEPARPKAPKIPKEQLRNPQNGLHLRAIHRHHLQDLVRARRLLDEIEAGDTAAAAFPEAVSEMELTQNFRLFGNLCGRECMVLHGHHNIEEQHMFPSLEATGNAGVQTVVAKLRAEHKIVHALIEQLHAAAVDLVQQTHRAHFEQARQLFDQIEAVVRSHFGYEETELQEALAMVDRV